MLSIMNEIDLYLLLPLCVLYEIQNQIFQHLLLKICCENIVNIKFLKKWKGLGLQTAKGRNLSILIKH